MLENKQTEQLPTVAQAKTQEGPRAAYWENWRRKLKKQILLAGGNRGCVKSLNCEPNKVHHTFISFRSSVVSSSVMLPTRLHLNFNPAASSCLSSNSFSAQEK
jgi:hypothetical protein